MTGAVVRGGLTALALCAVLSGQDDPLEYFEKRVRPVMAERCYACHGPKAQMGGINFATGAGVAQFLTPGDPAASRLYQALAYTEKVKMPPAGKLADAERAVFKTWIEQGARWPATATAAASAGEPAKSGKRHWSFEPVAAAAPPSVKNEAWVRDPLDRFVLAGLEAKGLRPAGPASKLELLRRVTFDLTGLPPTLGEIEAFTADSSPDAYRKVVERLLASPRYGERWGRHWLDVARLADSTGLDEDNLYPHAWRYRDYVVAAFNNDTPFNRFIEQQIAGDLLPWKTKDERAENLTATGFLALGPRPLAQQDRLQAVYDIVDEQIDTVSKAVLGLTISCARCHDHKFDPILRKEYYSLASIFASTRQFRNHGRPGSISYMHYEPLDAEAYARYGQHRRAMLAKQLEMEDALAEDLGRDTAPVRQKVAALVTAAWQVAKNGATVDAAATAQGVDPRRLARWVEWFGKAGMEKFDKATAETIAAVAADLDKEYNASATKWDQSLEGWRTRLAKEVAQDRDLPERPKPDAEAHPFFVKTTFGEGAPPMAVPESGRVVYLRQEWEHLKKTLPEAPALVSAVVDGPIIEQRDLLRGSLNNPGDPVAKGAPAVLGNGIQVPAGSSGRLELARWLASAENPLTARVFVNRVWLGHFGEALVRTPANWGLTGEKPTHPALLNYLATEFVAGGWSVKQLHRRILLSNAYQMSTHAPAESRTADPANQLLSRFPRTRLAIEQIRDSYLALDGSLDLTMGGTLLVEKGGKRQKVDADEVTRRTLYLPVRRGSIPPLLATFDFGDATTPGQARSRTNVAPQALYVRNSKFVVERARGLARRLLDVEGLTDGQRVERAYLMTLTRRPEATELDEALSYIDALARRLGGSDAAASRVTAWQSFCHVLMSSNEFLF